MTAGLLKGDSTNILLSLLLFLSIASPGWSQTVGCKNNWPTDKTKAEEQLAIYSDALKQGNYRAAVPGIQWFLNNAPKWNTRLYVDGAEVYNKLAASEKNPAKKQVFIDSLMWLYDERVKNCGDEVTVLNRKATHAAIYNGQNKDRTAGVLSLFDRVIKISGPNVSDYVLENYFKMVQSNVMLLKNMNDDSVLVHYERIQDAIDKKIVKYQQENKQAEAEKLKLTKNDIDKLLPKLVTAEGLAKKKPSKN